MTDIIEISGPGDLGFTVAKVQAEAAATRAEQAKDQVLPARDQTIAARDVTVAARDIATAARDEAAEARAIAQPASVAALAARDEAVAARDLVLPARDVTLAARDLVLPARDVTLAARDLVLPARDVTLAAKDETVAARDLAVPAKNIAVTARDEAVAARDTTVAARDVATGARDVTVAARDVTTAARDAAAASATAAAASLAQMPASRATVAEADAATLTTRWVGPDGLANRPLRKSASVTINVAVGGDIQAAINSLSAYIFEGAATGDVVLAAGVHTLPSAAGLYCQHPQGSAGRIRLLGTGAITVPVEGDWSSVKATDQAMLRAKCPTVVVCQGNGVDVSAASSTGLYVDKIAFERQGAEGGYGIYGLGAGHDVTIGTVAASGFTQGVRIMTKARLLGVAAGGVAVLAYNGTNLALSQKAEADTSILGYYPTGSNVTLDKASWNSNLACQLKGGSSAIVCAAGSEVTGNITFIKDYTFSAINTDSDSRCILTHAVTIESTAAATYAIYNRKSRVKLHSLTVNDANPASARTIYTSGSGRTWTGTVTGTPVYSPALQTLGNDNAYISV